MMNVDCVLDIESDNDERKIANCKKSEHEIEKEITHIKSEPSILDGKKHVTSVHKGIQHNCELCNYKATSPSKLKIHVESVHEGIKHNCELCDYKATRKESLKRHVESIHRGIIYSCELCDYKATRKEYLKRHVQSI